MMHHKALLFGDHAVAAQVLAAGHPRAVKALGRKVAGFSEAAWLAARERIVEDANYAKFTWAGAAADQQQQQQQQQPRRRDGGGGGGGGGRSLRARLLATGTREIVEASPYDRIWGVGFTEAHADDLRDEWGLNLLGKALMTVRERLRREEQEEAEKERAEA